MDNVWLVQAHLTLRRVQAAAQPLAMMTAKPFDMIRGLLLLLPVNLTPLLQARSFWVFVNFKLQIAACMGCSTRGCMCPAAPHFHVETSISKQPGNREVKG